MRNSLIIALVFLLSMTCHAQKISMSDLVGKTWVADSGYDGCGNIDWNIVFERKYTYKGKEYEDFFCRELLSLESNRLTIRMKHSTILFIAK